MRRSWYTM